MFNPFGDYSALKSFTDYGATHIKRVTAVGVLLLALYGAFSFVDSFVPIWATNLATRGSAFEDQAKTYQLIDIILHRSLTLGNAGRVLMFRFHNNTHDIEGGEFFFASPTNMVGKPGVTLDAPPNVPASVYAQTLGDGGSILSKLIKHSVCYIVSDDMPSGFLKNLYTKHGTVAVLYVGVYGLADELIGFVVFSWQDIRDVPQGAKMDTFVVSQQIEAAVISGYLYHLPPRRPTLGRE